MKNRHSKATITLLLLLLFAPSAWSQFISYPTPAEDITRGYGSGHLTVRIDFIASCSATPVITINLGAVNNVGTVNYVKGSLVTNLASSGISITEGDISNLSAPQFNVSGVSTGAYIEFEIQRNIGCGVGTFTKDFVSISGDCPKIEDDPNENVYNIKTPAFTITALDSINNAVVGEEITRSIKLSNGGNGATDTVRLYIVYPNNDIVNTNGNKISVDAVDFSPVAISGDTLFYKIYGATIFGGDNEFDNSESIIISEPIKIIKCNPKTTYSASWGENDDNQCQKTSVSNNIIMAIGVPNLANSKTTNKINFTSLCEPWGMKVSLKNSGSSFPGKEKAGGMYNVKISIEGYYGGNIGSHLNTATYSDFNINGNALAVSGSNTTKYTIDLADKFTFDPDGPGVGLDDLDGDGYYDDLPQDATIDLSWTVNPICKTTCGGNFYQLHSYKMHYNNMCGDDFISPLRRDAYYISETTFGSASYIPPNIIAGIPFRLSLGTTYYSNNNTYFGVNGRYQYRIVLPKGFSVAPESNITYGTGTPTVSTIPGSGSNPDTLIIQSPNNKLDTAGINLVYTCDTSSVGGPTSIWHSLVKIQDYTKPCICNGVKFCEELKALVHCSGSKCTSGPINLEPKVRRIDNCLGWTDHTMTTRQSASAISDYDLSKALYLDTIQIQGSAIQRGVNADNLHLHLSLPTASGRVKKLEAVDMTVEIYRGNPKSLYYTCNESVASDSSKGSMQIIDWNVCLPPGGLIDGDSIVGISRYVVATNKGLPQYDIQSGDSWFFYNKVGNTKEYCNYWTPEMYLVGTNLIIGTNSANLSGCKEAFLGGNFLYLARRFNALGKNYQNEFRPMVYIDSIVLTKSPGYDLVSTDFIRATPSYTVNLTPNIVNGNSHTFINDGTWPIMPITKVNYYGGYFKAKVKPNCATTETEYFITKIYIRDYYYAFGDPDKVPSTYQYIMSNYSNSNIASGTGHSYRINYETSGKPSITVENTSGVAQGIDTSQYWDVKLSNLSTSTIPNVWLALEKGTSSGNIAITSVVDLATGDTLVGKGAYSCSGVTGYNWFETGTVGLNSGESKTYRVNFSYSSCDLDSILFKTGWDCSGYPTTNPCDYSCAGATTSTYLKVLPQPSQMQLSITREPGNGNPIVLCTADTVEFVINSALGNSVLNPKFIVTPPSGINIISQQIEYPHGSGNWETITPINLDGILTYNAIDHTALAALSGLPGVINNPNSSDRQAKLRLIYTADCDFKSGSKFKVVQQGDKPCGIRIPNSLGYNDMVRTGPVKIIGTIGVGIVDMSMGVSSGTINCDNVTVSGTLMPIAIPFSAQDTMLITLPAGIAYNVGSFTGSAGMNFTGITNGPGGSTLLTVALPADTGVGVDYQLSYSISVKPTDLSGCKKFNLSSEVVRIGAILTCNSTPCPRGSKVVAGSADVDLNVNKSDVTLLNASIVSNGSGNSSFSITLKNSGTAIPANGLTLDFFCDSSHTPFASGNFPSAIASGATITNTITLGVNIPCGSSGTVRIVANPATSNNCLCSNATINAYISKIVANDDSYTGFGTSGFTTGSVLSNDKLNNNPINPVDVILTYGTVENEANNDVSGKGWFSLNADGTITVAPNTPAGNYTVTYTICEKSNITNCDDAIVTITVLVPSYTISKTADATGIKNPAQVGNQIVYTIVITNTGNVDINNVNVVDSMLTAAGIELGAPVENVTTDSVLNIGETWTYTINYPITQEDINAGQVYNKASVSGEDTSGNIVPTASDDVITPLTQNAAYTISKTADATGVQTPAQIGDQIVYTIIITNTGNLNIRNIIVTDPMLATAGIALGTPEESVTKDSILNVGETWTYIINYPITQADINAGQVYNKVSVSGKSQLGNIMPTASDDVTTPLTQNANYTISKTADDSGVRNPAKVGDQIIYTIVITNTGNVDISNVVVTDPMLTAAGIELGAPVENVATDNILNAGETWTYTVNYPITQEDIDAGHVYNKAYVYGKDPSGNIMPTISNDVTTTLAQKATYTISKTADASSLQNPAQVGDQIIYTIVITNTGNVDISNINVTDSMLTAAGIALGAPVENGTIDNVLNTSETWTYTVNYPITQEDIDAGHVYNKASVSGEDPSGNIVPSVSDDVTTTLTQNAALSITKVGSYNAGIITYTFTVTNTGNVDLTNVNVTDDLAGLSAISPSYVATLEIGSSAIFTAKYTVTQADINAGGVWNIAIASAKDPSNRVVTETSTDPNGPYNPGDDGYKADCIGCTYTKIDKCSGNMSALINIISENSCYGLNDAEIEVIVSGGMAPYTYTLNNVVYQENIIKNLAAGEYAFTINDFNNCTTNTSFVINSASEIQIDIVSIIHDNCNNTGEGEIEVEVNGGTSPYFYHWSNGCNISKNSSLNAGDYFLTVTDNNGCEKVIGAEINSVSLDVLPSAHNAFSPNNDGKNETFVFANLEKFPENELLVYNNWGNEVYSKTNYDNSWDGSNLSEGTYFWILKIKVCGEEERIKGYVTLLR
ncbi:MAG: DUF11 domain-containing protein [Bacteroidales bacterium]|nr:DUF11 domain-containing protein [Bacteroidales bacterium]